jgi:acyl-CoA thioesterase-1
MSFESLARPVLLASAVTLTGACHSSSTPTAATAGVELDVVAFGDSLTAGYGIEPSAAFPAVLQQYLTRENLPFRVVNAGVSGDTTGTALRRLPAVVARRPAIVIVALGANDGLRGVSVATMRENLSRVIREFRGAGAQVLLCGMEALPTHGFSYSVRFHNLFVELAREHDVPLVPFFMATVVGRQELLLPDMVHPNAAGARVIADVVWPYLEPLARAILV